MPCAPALWNGFGANWVLFPFRSTQEASQFHCYLAQLWNGMMYQAATSPINVPPCPKKGFGASCRCVMHHAGSAGCAVCFWLSQLTLSSSYCSENVAGVTPSGCCVELSLCGGWESWWCALYPFDRDLALISMFSSSELESADCNDFWLTSFFFL